MVAFNTLLARPVASERIIWRDWVKSNPKEMTKIGTAMSRMPRLSLAENERRMLNIGSLLSYLLFGHGDEIIEQIGNGGTVALDVTCQL